METIELTWNGKDGQALFGREWRPSGEAAGVVCLIHGLGEHSGRYQFVGSRLAEAGYAVHSFDLRGHGKSPGPRGYSPSYEHILDDIGESIARARAAYPVKPLYLYGHSMGGGLVLNYALRREPAPDAVIASAPSLKPATRPPAWKTTAGRLLYNILPALPFPHGLPLHGISCDPAVYEAYMADPLVHDQVSCRLGIDIINYGVSAYERAEDFKLPLLLVQGTADQLVNASANIEFARKAGGPTTIKVYEGSYHELHNEPMREQFIQEVIAWLDERSGRQENQGTPGIEQSTSAQ